MHTLYTASAASTLFVLAMIGNAIADASDNASEWLPPCSLLRLGRLEFRAQLSGKRGAAVSYDGKLMAVIPACDSSLIDVFDLKTGLRLATVHGSKGKNLMGELAFSPNGMELLAVDGNDRLSGWDLPSRRQIASIECQEPRHIDVSSDGRTVAVTVRGGADIRTWPSGELKQAIRTEDDEHFDSVRFSDEDGCVLGVSRYRWRTWRVDDGTLVNDQERNVPENGTHDMYGIDPKRQIGVCLNPTDYGITVFSTANGSVLHQISTNGNPNRAALLGNTGRIAIGRKESSLSIEVLDGMTGKTLKTLSGHSEPLYAFKASFDGSTLVGFSKSRQWVWDYASGRLREYCLGHAKITDVAFSPVGAIVASTGPSVDMRGPNGEDRLECFDGVRFWNYSTGKLLHEVPNFRLGAFSHDGRFAWLWNHAGAIQKVNLQSFVATNASVVRESEKSLLIVGEADQHQAQAVRLRKLKTWQASGDAMISAAALCEPFSEEKSMPARLSMIASAWENRETFPRSPAPFTGSFEDIAVSANGTTFAYEYRCTEGRAEKSCIGIENTDAEKSVWVECDEHNLERLVVSADGTQVLGLLSNTESSDDLALEVRLWTASNGELVRRWKIEQIGFEPGSAVLALSPDSKLFAVGTGDGHVRIWGTELADVVPLASTSGHEGGITSLAFSPDNRLLATGSADSTVLIFDVAQLLAGVQR